MNALSPDYFSAIRAAESGGDDRAKNPRSSATGRYQFIESTWNGLMKSRPDLGLTPDGRLDPAQQERAIQAFTADNARILERAGIPVNNGTLYAAHFLGAGGAVKALSANPNAPIEAVVGDGVVKANPFLRGKTVADFQGWASSKAGGGSMPSGGPYGGQQNALADGFQQTQFEPMIPVGPVGMAEGPQRARQDPQMPTRQEAAMMPLEAFQAPQNALAAPLPQYDTTRYNTRRLTNGA